MRCLYGGRCDGCRRAYSGSLREVKVFFRVLRRSLTNRKAHLAVAAGAVLLGTALIAALLSLSLGLGPKVRGELQAYGANLILIPQVTTLEMGAGGLEFGAVSQEAYISEEALASLERPPLSQDIIYYLPYLYAVVEVGGRQVVLAGTHLSQAARTNTWWRIDGEVGLEVEGAALVGAEAARVLGLAPGDSLVIAYRGVTQELKVAGVVETGAAEDSQLLVNLSLAQRLTARLGAVQLIQAQVSTAQRPLSQIAQDIQSRSPGVQVKIVEQVARAEARVLGKVQFLLALVATLVLAASALAVFSTMTSSVLERLPEVGLMKALGASPAQVGRFFLTEALVTGVAAGLAGYALGLLLAEAIARTVFDVYLGVQPLALPMALALALAVTVLASALPVRRAMGAEPAFILKGE